MATPKWLTDLIKHEYLPAVRELSDTPEDRVKAQEWAAWMKQQWATHGLKQLKQQRNLMTAVRGAIKTTLGENHVALESMNFTIAEWTAINNRIQDRVSERNEHQQFLEHPSAITGKAVRLLESREWAEVAAGLTVLTGRRSSEILSTAKFEPHPNNRWSVVFTGALKRRGETQMLSFEIPTLTTAERVCGALGKLRGWIQTEGMTAEEVNAKYGDAVSKACDRNFAEWVPLRDGRDNLYTHLFRSVYAAIATFWYCPPQVAEMEFKAQIQGHFGILDEVNPERRRSLAASRHYSDYLISDGKGNVDGRKGIKLGYGGVVPIEAFAGSWDRGKVEEQVKGEGQEGQRASVRIWQADRAHLETIFERLGLDQAGTQQDRMRSLLLWVDERLEEEVKQEFAPQVETDSAIAEMVPVEEPTEVPLVSGLEGKIDKLIDVMTRFVEGQMNAAKQPGVKAITQPKPSESKPVKATVEAGEPKRERSTAGAEGKVNAAIDAIIAFNSQPELEHADKWAIGISVLKKLTGCYQGVIARVLEERKEELEKHHQLHGLGVTHNNYHRGKRVVNEVIRV